MPPRYAYWTILAGGLPTAFRAGDREELLPTFNRLREKHPDAELKYFAHGKLWASPEAARAGREQRVREDRGRDWRPGGSHRDPRQKFRDQKKQRNQNRRLERFAWKDRQAGGRTRPVEHTERPERRAGFARHEKPFQRQHGAEPAGARQKWSGKKPWPRESQAPARKPRADKPSGGPPWKRQPHSERPTWEEGRKPGFHSGGPFARKRPQQSGPRAGAPKKTFWNNSRDERRRKSADSDDAPVRENTTTRAPKNSGRSKRPFHGRARKP